MTWVRLIATMNTCPYIAGPRDPGCVIVEQDQSTLVTARDASRGHEAARLEPIHDRWYVRGSRRGAKCRKLTPRRFCVRCSTP
jgi:hypothetical protein